MSKMAPPVDPSVTSDASFSFVSKSESPDLGLIPPPMAQQPSPFRQTVIRAGDEVDFFSGELDRHLTDLRGTTEEKRAQVFQLVDSYHAYSRKRADRLRERQPRKLTLHENNMEIDDNETDDMTANLDEEYRKAEEEAQTWDLLRRMLPLEYGQDETAQLKQHTKPSVQSRNQWWNDFMLSDSLAREQKVVLEWLQSSASQGPPVDDIVSHLQESAERGDILAHGWLHTRTKIKLQKSVNGYQGALDPRTFGFAESHLSSNTLVTQLDPDAITRQARKLETQDDFFERAIWLGCFEMLRRGYSMAEIREWCSVRTELWRAASLAPLPLANPEDEDQPDFDPRSLVVWRRMCFSTARDGGTSDYDRAVYGLLAGDIASVEKVCESWDDLLFAHYNALLRTRFDSFLVKHGGDEVARAAQQFPAFNAVLHHGDPHSVSKRLVTLLESDSRTSTEATRPAKALQGAIIAHELGRYLTNQGLVLAKHANQRSKSNLIPPVDLQVPDDLTHPKYFNLSDHNSLRVLSHVLIIFSTLNRLSGTRHIPDVHQDAMENIIAAYISYLRLANLEEMIPLYCSKLHGQRVYEALSRNLTHILDNDARRVQVSIMNRLGISVSEFVKRQPEVFLNDVNDLLQPCEAKGKFKVLEDGPATLKYGRIVKPDFFGDDEEQELDKEEGHIICSLEWLMLTDDLFVETCTYVIRAYKYFLKRTRLRAARALSQRVPGREIIRRKTGILVGGEEDDDSIEWFAEFAVSELPEELLALYAGDKDAVITQVRNMWELECLVKALDSMETLSSLAGLAREDSTNSREMWQHTSKEVRAAKVCMQPVLRGWLLEAIRPDPDFQALREAYIPETVLALVSSLHFAGATLSRDYLLECMELAAVVAEKASTVAQEFVKSGRMKELVEAFASCSKALAIFSSEKKATAKETKKIRENGWSRELWSVKPLN